MDTIEPGDHEIVSDKGLDFAVSADSDHPEPAGVLESDDGLVTVPADRGRPG